MSSMTQAVLSPHATKQRHTPDLVVYSSLWGRSLPYVLSEREQKSRFSFALRKAMSLRGTSARALAQKLGIDPRRIAAWLGEKGLPNLYESQALADALGVDEDLFKNPPEVPPLPPEPYYPLEKYVLEARRSGEQEGHRRASTRRDDEDPGSTPPSHARPARGSGSGRG